jgi:hypothetical protein
MLHLLAAASQPQIVQTLLKVLLKPAFAAGVLGVAIPLLTALAAKKGAPAIEKSIIAVVVTAGGTVVIWLTHVTGSTFNPTTLGFIAVGGIVTAVAHRWTWLTPFEAIISNLIPGGIPIPGAAKLATLAVHSGQPTTDPRATDPATHFAVSPDPDAHDGSAMPSKP